MGIRYGGLIIENERLNLIKQISKTLKTSTGVKDSTKDADFLGETLDARSVFCSAAFGRLVA